MSSEPQNLTLLAEMRNTLSAYSHTFIRLMSDTERAAATGIKDDVRKILEVDATLKDCLHKLKLWTQRQKKAERLEKKLHKLNTKLVEYAGKLSSAEVDLYNYLDRSERLQKELEESRKVSIQDVITTSRVIAPAASGSCISMIDGSQPWMPSNERMRRGLAKDEGLSLNAPNVAARSVFTEKLETNRGAAFMDYSDSEYDDE